VSFLIWAFVPYSVRDGVLDGFDYDTTLTKRELACAFNELGLPWVWQPVVESNIDAVVAQTAGAESIVLNLCDGIDGKGTPGLRVVKALERAGVPFTGANSEFYEISTSKIAMKQMMGAAGVRTPEFEELTDSIDGVCERVGAPVLVKPDVSAASGGIFLRSKVSCGRDALALRDELRREPLPIFCDGRRIFAERFIDGPEYTAFVMGDWNDARSIRCLAPVERLFNASVPDGEKFLSYERYWAEPKNGERFYWHGACDPGLTATLEAVSKRAYVAVHGRGYARVDLRMDRATGELFVLEVNANCELSEDDQTATGYILKSARMTLAGLLEEILRDAR